MANAIKKVAIVGERSQSLLVTANNTNKGQQASGNVGGPVLKHLLTAGRFNITIITRTSSTSKFPDHPSILVKRGSYDDPLFLQDCFASQDLAIFTLSVTAAQSDQDKLLDAAAKAGVKWLIPNEFASDGTNDAMTDGSPLFRPKRETRKYIGTLAQSHPGLHWIAVVTNPWVENSIHPLLLGMDLPARTATIAWDSGHFNLSTLDRVGEGIASLLCLPIENPENPRASLQHYADNFVYLSSVFTTQQETFESIQRLTGTTEKDWKVQPGSIANRIRDANEALAAGGDGVFPALMDLMCSHYIAKDLGGDYQSKALEDLKVLGLKEQELDEVFKSVVNAGSRKIPAEEDFQKH